METIGKPVYCTGHHLSTACVCAHTKEDQERLEGLGEFLKQQIFEERLPRVAPEHLAERVLQAAA